MVIYLYVGGSACSDGGRSSSSKSVIVIKRYRVLLLVLVLVLVLVYLPTYLPTGRYRYSVLVLGLAAGNKRSKTTKMLELRGVTLKEHLEDIYLSTE